MNKEATPMREKLTNIPREIRRKVTTSVWEGLLYGLDLEFSQESQQNLLAINELLKEGSVVIYINHTSMVEDVALPVSMIFTFLTNAKRIIGPVAMRHYDFSRDWKNAILLRLLKQLGVEILPIVQPEKIDKKAMMYGHQEKQRMGNALRAEMIDAVKNPGTVIGITPEGTRSKNGKLLLAKRGIGYLESYDPDDMLSYIPVLIELKKFSNPPKIEVGKPLKLGEMNLGKNTLPEHPRKRAQALANIHMQRLADMLSPEMRGVYNREK